MGAGVAEELFRLLDEGAPLGGAGDGDAAAASELEKALVPELTERTQHGVRVDAENVGEVFRGRKALAGPRLAVGDCPPDLAGDSLVEVERVVAADLDIPHGASDSSFSRRKVSSVPVTVLHRSTEAQDDLEQRVAALEALIEEARRRARRRRSIYGAIVLAALGTAVWASFDVGGNGGASLGRSASAGSPSSSAAESTAAGWRTLRGPQGGTIFAIAIDPTDSKIVYAAGWGRVFESSNAGGSWKRVSNEPWQEIESLAVDPVHPGTVYAGTDRGIGKTVDGGRHWRMINTGLFGGQSLPKVPLPPNGSLAGALTIDPQHPATVYATTGLGLYRTTNGGMSWRSIVPAPLRREICRTCPLGRGYTAISFAIDPTHTDSIYAAATPTAGLLYKSSDGGDSWRRVPTATPLKISGLVVTDSGALLASIAPNSGMFRSTDGGVTWAPDGLSGATVGTLTVDPGSGAIYATTVDGAMVFRTTDNGDGWQTVSKSFGWFGAVTDPTDAATIYATTNDGIVKSVNGGRTWAAADKGLVSILVSAVAVAPGSPATVYAGTSGGLVFESTNMGKTWRAANTGLGSASVTALAVDPKQPHMVFAGTSSGGLFESSNAGGRWSRLQTALNNVLAIAIDPQHPSTMYVADCRTWCSAGTLRKTDDAGAHWRTVAGVPSSALSVAINPRHSDTVFVGTARGDILRSSDGGRSWRRVAQAPTLPLSHQYAIAVIAIDPNDPDNVYAGRPTGGIIKSSDGGDTWTRANAGLTNRTVNAIAIDPADSRTLFASTRGGVFVSRNSGASWNQDDRSIPEGGVAAFAIDQAGRILYAGTNGDGIDSLSLPG